MLRSALVAVAGLTVLLAACGGGSRNDNGALAGPVPAGSAPPPGASYQPVTVSQSDLGSVRYPIVAGVPQAAALNAALLAQAQTLTSKHVACAVSTLRADTLLLSFQWTCAGQGGLTATFETATGQQVVMGDLFTSGYLDQLSATAITQLQLGGATAAQARAAASPTPADFREWGLDDSSLQVTFTVDHNPTTISFPLASLQAITNPKGLLGRTASSPPTGG